jgi:gamma-glutamyltranspeptidase/glutathione hydrolase
LSTAGPLLRRVVFFATLGVALLLGSPARASTPPGEIHAENAVVAADSPIASAVGVEILQRGGNAVDAAVAVGLTLGVVNPFASGLGGGGFMLVRSAEDGAVRALDFREIAPSASTRDMFLVDGTASPDRSRYGGLAVAAPTELIGWWEAHQRYGSLPWRDVVEPARRLADEGFTVHPLLARRLESASELLQRFPRLQAEFSVDGRLARTGDRLARPALAATLTNIAEHGPGALMEGPAADHIANAVVEAGGVMTRDDLANADVRWTEAVVSRYRGYEIHGMPPPSSGGLTVAQILETLEAFALDRGRFGDPITTHIIAQAFAHAFADRAWHIGDPDFHDVPHDRFLGDARIDEAQRNYQPVRHLDATRYGPLTEPPSDDGTSHFSIVDADGNAVACTVTINTSFGSGVFVPEVGIVLNNEMDDFAAAPGVPNVFGLVGGEANAVEPGKRPLSSMSPTIVSRDGVLVGALGGSGGPMIITETVLGLVQLIDFERSAGEAVRALRFHYQWLPETLFVEPDSADRWQDNMRALGYTVEPRSFWSALQIVWAADSGWQAASDPRKLGAPAGY